MKLWYDDKKIPTWVEVVCVVVFAVVLGLMFSLGVLGISLGQFVLSLFN
jgi:high-affinity Fe2+/Pb2+ permease